MHELDRILEPLFHSCHTGNRLAVLRELVAYRYGPLDSVDRFSQRHLPTPEVLREWYQWAGSKADILKGHNSFFSCEPPPANHCLEISDGLLAFQSENQGCYFWATEPSGDDPPVYGRASSSDAWRAEGSVLSEHLIASLIFETFADPEFFTGFAALIDDKTFETISAFVPPLPIAAWHWPTWPARFHAGNGVFMMTVGEVGGQGIYVSAKEQQLLLPLAGLPAIDWNYRTF